MFRLAQRRSSMSFFSLWTPNSTRIVKGSSFLRSTSPWLVTCRRQASRLAAVEGSVRLEFPADRSVFFNSHDSVMRDLKVLVAEAFARNYLRDERLERHPWWMQTYEEEPPEKITEFDSNFPLRLLDCCTATGVSGLRLTKELTREVRTILCDSSSVAAECAYHNARTNAPDCVIVENSDYCSVVLNHRDPDDRFDIIDVDPSYHPLHEAMPVMEGISNGGLLLFHVRCGVPLPSCLPDVCIEQDKSSRQMESNMRVFLGHLHMLATMKRKAIDPLLTVNFQGDIIAAVRVNHYDHDQDHAHDKVKAVLFCRNCQTRLFQSFSQLTGSLRCSPERSDYWKHRFPTSVSLLCPVCSDNLCIAGEAWSDRMTNKQFLLEMRAVLKQANGVSKWFSESVSLNSLLAVLHDEVDNAFSIDLKDMAARTSSPEIPVSVCIAALQSAGFDVSRTHVSSNAICTNAPPACVWDVFHFWMKRNGKDLTNTPVGLGRLILERDPKISIEFPSEDKVHQ